MKPVLCPAELQADIVNYSTLCKRCKHVDRIENGEATRIFRYIFQSACQNRKYGLQYLCYKRVPFTSRLNSDISKTQDLTESAARFQTQVLGNEIFTKQSKHLFFIGVWRSLLVRLTEGQEAMGSSPVTPTKKLCECKMHSHFL